MKVPPLFEPEAIRAVLAQLEANKTYHGQTVNRYF
jgi:hypothetical protein